ncbi:MAG: 23S rRNA pseudouridine1911/1915/1917 synthase [Bradymonadia bacterium]
MSVDGKAAKKRSQRLVEGTTVKAALVPPRTLETLPQDIPLEILYEDDHVVVVNKPTGMVVHPAAGHPDGTLVNALLFHCAGRLSSVGGAIRPGIVHRIDKDTSGVLVCSKTDEAHVLLQQQFAAHTVKRQYMALSARTTGRGIGESGTFHTRHGRHLTDRKKFTGKSGEREAITHYEVIESFRDGARLVRCELETGRTHQIRVHLAEAGAPILGDPIYGGTSVARSPLVTRTALHAQTLGFIAPNGEELYFEADLPEDFQNALDRLRRGATWRK